MLLLVVSTQVVAEGRLRIDLLAPEIAREMTPQAINPDAIQDGQILISSIELRGEQLLFPALGITREVMRERLVDTYLRQGPTLSVGEMHRLADELTRYYREHGLTFATVVVIPQEIVNGSLILRLRSGRLAEIHTHGNSLYSSQQLMAPFREQMGGPVYEPAVEQALDRLNRQAGLRVFGIFSMGTHDGETRLNLRVRKEQRQRTEIRIDNHGLDDTGEYRLLLRHSVNNPFRDGGTLSATALVTNESGNLLGGLAYQRPFADRSRLELSLMRSEFSLGGDFSVLGLGGTLDMASVAWGLDNLAPWDPRSRARVTLAAKRAEVDSDVFSEVLAERFSYFTLSPQLTRQWRQARWRLHHEVTATPLFGVVTSSSGNNPPDSSFNAISGQYRGQHDWAGAPGRFPSQVSLEGTFSPDGLPSSERFSLTGPNGVRGFSPGLFSADSAYKLVLEQTLYALQWRADWQLRPFIFADHAQGLRVVDGGSDSSARFLGAGLGVELGYRNLARAGLNWGYALDQGNSSDLIIEQENNALYGYLSVRF
ncbi:MAG: ShlB/FhaC/HecB family hemolysin secretion/activation protein [Halomonadaceae bacterium]|nr:MAG: ShlB/FhaC/HecB family hemolysin secretion/activation protein [Halomonadaceae bacterium]